MAHQKKGNAPAHAPASTTACAIPSNPARYIAQHLSPYHTGARLSGRRYIPKCLHLALNSYTLKLPATVSNIQHGAQLASQTPGRGKPHKHPATSKRYKHPVTSEGEELARQGESEELAAAGKGEELARRVRVANTQRRVRVKNCAAGLVSETVPLIRGFYRKQFFIPSTISPAYMISPAYRSARNDKFCLYSTNVLLRMILIFKKYTCTTSLDTTLAGSDTHLAGSNFF